MRRGLPRMSRACRRRSRSSSYSCASRSADSCLSRSATGWCTAARIIPRRPSSTSAVLDRLERFVTAGSACTSPTTWPRSAPPRAAAPAAAGRLLRYGLSSRPSGGRRSLRHSRSSSMPRGYAVTDSTVFPTSTSRDGSPRWHRRSPRAASSSRISAAARPCARSRRGKSVESTMGFTALDGLPMGTRPGQLDAGVVLYLMSEKGMSADRKSRRLLYNDCGLKGLSGISNDVRELLASPDPRAKLALEYFVLSHRCSPPACSRPRWTVSTPSCSPPASERTRPPFAKAVLRRLSWLGVELATRSE